MIKFNLPSCRVVLITATFLLTGGYSLPAQAVIPPPCEATECPGTGPTAWESVATASVAALEALEVFIFEEGLYFKDALTRLANQISNADDKFTKLMSSMTDTVSAASAAIGISEARMRAFDDISPPSRTVCGSLSKQNVIAATYAPVRAAVATVETTNTNLYTNAPGTAGQRGQIAYTMSEFSDRMNKYCNPNAITVPAGAGFTCSASIGADLDIQPAVSIFSQSSLATNASYTAATDVVQNIVGDNVRDPVRGPALLREEGRTASVNLYGDQAKANMAASILMSMVERRKLLSTGTSAVKAQEDMSYTGQSLKALAVANAEHSDSQNADQLAQMIGDNSRGLFMLRNFFEQWAAVRAVSLAIDVKQHSVGNGTVAGRAIGN